MENHELQNERAMVTRLANENEQLRAEIAELQASQQLRDKAYEPLQVSLNSMTGQRDICIDAIWKMAMFHIENPTSPDIHEVIPEQMIHLLLEHNKFPEIKNIYFAGKTAPRFADSLVGLYSNKWTPILSIAGCLTMIRQINVDPAVVQDHLRWMALLIPIVRHIVSDTLPALLYIYFKLAIRIANVRGMDAALLHLCIASFASLQRPHSDSLSFTFLRRIFTQHNDGTYLFNEWTILEKITCAVLLNSSTVQPRGLFELPDGFSIHIIELMRKVRVISCKAGFAIIDILTDATDIINNLGGKVLVVTNETKRMVLLKDTTLLTQSIWVIDTDKIQFTCGEMALKKLTRHDGTELLIGPRNLVSQDESSWFKVTDKKAFDVYVDGDPAQKKRHLQIYGTQVILRLKQTVRSLLFPRGQSERGDHESHTEFRLFSKQRL